MNTLVMASRKKTSYHEGEVEPGNVCCLADQKADWSEQQKLQQSAIAILSFFLRYTIKVFIADHFSSTKPRILNESSL